MLPLLDYGLRHVECGVMGDFGSLLRTVLLFVCVKLAAVGRMSNHEIYALLHVPVFVRHGDWLRWGHKRRPASR